MPERCRGCNLSCSIKNGDQYVAPNGDVFIRTAGDGIFRGCVEQSDNNAGGILITTNQNPKCIFPGRFEKREVVGITTAVASY